MKHIIDTTSPDFDGIPMRLRESHKGMVLLEEDRREDGSLRGLVTMEPESLSTRMDEHNLPADFPVSERSKLFIEYIADDVEDKAGHKKYRGVLADLLDDTDFKVVLEAKNADIISLKSKLEKK